MKRSSNNNYNNANGKNNGNNGKPRKRQKKKKTQRQFDVTKYKKRYVALHVAYFGHKYRGYASQADTTETIEHYLFEALKKTCLIVDRKSSSYSLSGRTDAGVSAVGQVISIYLRSKQLASSINDNPNEKNSNNNNNSNNNKNTFRCAAFLLSTFGLIYSLRAVSWRGPDW